MIALYVRYALTRPDPIIDLRLMKLATFRVSATGGTLFRIGVGALPFLLPLMFQIGFGLTAFQSGLMTLASGIGAMVMKFVAQPLLRRFGFRKVLMANACRSAIIILAPATFTPQTPWLWIVAVLFIGGISRSLQFTAVNAVAYADVPTSQLSSATSFSAVLQQLSGSIGITVAAFGLEAMQAVYGDTPLALTHFPAVYAMIAGLSLLSVVTFGRLSKDAGAALLTKDNAPVRSPEQA